MTKVKVIKEKTNINKITLNGHAFYNQNAEDIVCSAISMICYTIGNQLLIIDENKVKITIKEGYFAILLKEINNENQLLMDTLLTGLKMLEEQYKENIKIEEV